MNSANSGVEIMATKRIVIVAEDDVDIRDGITGILREEGYETRTASNGREALVALDALHGAPCILFLDLTMPVMSGAEVLTVLWRDRRLADIPVIVCSAVATMPNLPVGIRQFVAKPLSIDTLLDAIQNLCDDEPAKRPEMTRFSA